MLFRYAVLCISGLALCLIIITASAQTPEEYREAVRADLQALEEGYHQLRQDKLAKSAAAVETDLDNIAEAEQDFRLDFEKTIADDQKNVAADQRALDILEQQLQQDKKENPAAVAADRDDIHKAVRKLHSDSEKILVDDGLKVAHDQQVFDNEHWQLRQDLKGSEYIRGSADIVRADMQGVEQAKMVLQEARLMQQLDRNTQTQPR